MCGMSYFFFYEEYFTGGLVSVCIHIFTIISSFYEKRQSPKLVSEFRLQLLHRGLVFKVAKNQAWTTSLQPLIKIQISSMIFTGPR
ncbi:unnamed protein product [Brassica oleracea var. botrytis]